MEVPNERPFMCLSFAGNVLGIGEVTRGAFVGIRKRVHLMPNLKGSPATDNCNRDIILKKQKTAYGMTSSLVGSEM
eukprot:3643447-Prorocentrum_lima.AAC.1